MTAQSSRRAPVSGSGRFCLWDGIGIGTFIGYVITAADRAVAARRHTADAIWAYAHVDSFAVALNGQDSVAVAGFTLHRFGFSASTARCPKILHQMMQENGTVVVREIPDRRLKLAVDKQPPGEYILAP